MDENLEILRKLIIKKYNIDVRSKKRLREVVDAKKIFCLIAFNEINRISYSNIARFIEVTHATILHHIKKAKDHLKYDPEFKSKYDKIEDIFFLLNKEVEIQQIDSEIYLCQKRIDFLKKQRSEYLEKSEQIEMANETVEVSENEKILMYVN